MVPAAILAAGASSRMGRPKALLPIGVTGECFLARIIRTLGEAGVPDIIVVLGHQAPAIRAALGDQKPGIRIVDNRDYARGQLSSVQTALDVVDRPGVRGLLITLVDLPLLSPSTVRAVLVAHGASGALIVRPSSEGRHGHPIIFDRRLFGELRQAPESLGAKAVVRAHAADVLDVETGDPGAFEDIDTPADYERLIGPCSGI